MKTLLLILSLLLITSNVYAEWTFYSYNINGDYMFYDKSTVKRNGDKIKVWTYINFAPDNKKAKSLNISSARTLEEIDCVNEIRKALTLHSYTKNNLEGDMRDMTMVDSSISYILPNSTYAKLMKLVCKK